MRRRSNAAWQEPRKHPGSQETRSLRFRRLATCFRSSGGFDKISSSATASSRSIIFTYAMRPPRLYSQIGREEVAISLHSQNAHVLKAGFRSGLCEPLTEDSVHTQACRAHPLSKTFALRFIASKIRSLTKNLLDGPRRPSPARPQHQLQPEACADRVDCPDFRSSDTRLHLGDRRLPQTRASCQSRLRQLGSGPIPLDSRPQLARGSGRYRQAFRFSRGFYRLFWHIPTPTRYRV
jgi:hypothetical protein